MNCLNQAIAEERIHQVRLLLSLGVDPEFRDKKDLYRTPLLKASRLPCEDSTLKITKILLKTGVNINAIDDMCRSSLHYAGESGKSAVIEILLKEGSVELNKQDKDGRTPLMLCAINGHLRTSRIMALRLIKFDLDIDLRDNDGFSALLLAIKNQNYDIAHDLIRYGNACTTIRDSTQYKNAAEWLKKTLCDNQHGFVARKRRELSTPENDKSKEAFGQSGVGNSEAIPAKSAVPVVTLQNSQESDNEQDTGDHETAASDVTSTMKEAAALSGLLFEPDPYGRHSRPPSSVLSKASLASSKKRQQRMPSPVYSESTIDAEPRADGQSIASYAPSDFTARHSIEIESSVDRHIPAWVATKSAQRGLRQASGARDSLLSASNRMRREAIANASVNLPVSFDRPPSRNNFLVLVKVPAKDQSRSNTQSIQKLKQAIEEQRKRKVTRPSTRLTRPYTAVPYEAWAENAGAKLPARPHTRAQAAGMRRASVAKPAPVPAPAPEAKVVEIVQPKEKLTSAQSHLSLNTLFTTSDVSDVSGSNAYRQPSAIERAQRNLLAIFSLYTDSYLWFPPTRKPASLSVQKPQICEQVSDVISVQGQNNSLRGWQNEDIVHGKNTRQQIGGWTPLLQMAPQALSDKLTLTSDRTASVSDLASITDKASVENLYQKQGLDGRGTSQRSRLMSGSATSRASRKSLGGKSANSGSFVR